MYKIHWILSGFAQYSADSLDIQRIFTCPGVSARFRANPQVFERIRSILSESAEIFERNSLVFSAKVAGFFSGNPLNFGEEQKRKKFTC